MTTFLWSLVGFLIGSLPFSVWIGRLFLRTDIRRFGNGNPGAANAWRAGRWQTGIPALLLDYSKGALPVGLAHFKVGLGGWELVPVALAPVLGHAFSPLLHFRGGKALAVTFGVWTGLSLGEVPLVLGLLFTLFYFVIRVDGWAVILGMLGLLIHLVTRQGNLALLATWFGNTLILAWKHRQDLSLAPLPRPALIEAVRRRLWK